MTPAPTRMVSSCSHITQVQDWEWQLQIHPLVPLTKTAGSISTTLTPACTGHTRTTLLDHGPQHCCMAHTKVCSSFLLCFAHIANVGVAAFNPISISIAGEDATPGFFFNQTGLQSNQSENGWLACDWWYQDPQIFAFNGHLAGPLPTSCSRVNLVPVAVT